MTDDDLLQRLTNAAGELLEHVDIADREFRVELERNLAAVLVEAEHALAPQPRPPRPAADDTLLRGIGPWGEAQQRLSLEWETMTSRVKEARDPNAMRRAVRWVLVSTFGDLVRYHHEPEFHARVHTAENLLDHLQYIRERARHDA